MTIYLPGLSADPSVFPPAGAALDEPNGLLAMGGDLTPARLLHAYRRGIFPWFSRGQPILWWTPDPRMVVAPQALHLSRSTRRAFAGCSWTACADRDFDAVVERCAHVPRHGQDDTWITRDMRRAYARLHALGHAHSVEVYAGTRLVGGIYGVAIGRMFFGESMFSSDSGGSKAAIGALCRRLAQWDYALLDGQVESPHLATLGFAPVPRTQFLSTCAQATAQPGMEGSWCDAFGEFAIAELASPAGA